MGAEKTTCRFRNAWRPGFGGVRKDAEGRKGKRGFRVGPGAFQKMSRRAMTAGNGNACKDGGVRKIRGRAGNDAAAVPEQPQKRAEGCLFTERA